LAKYENPRSHESHLVRGTSRVAWSRLVTSGRVDSDAARIYRLIRDHGPITDREGCERLGITDPNEYRPTRNTEPADEPRPHRGARTTPM
jgi:hypothetical protein